MPQPKSTKPPIDAARPLFPHASGKFAKKINGKLKYFGRWDDPAGALAEYQRFLDAPPNHGQAGRDSLSRDTRLSLKDACNSFLTAKEGMRDRRELAQSSFADYRRTCQRLIDHFGPATAVESLGPAGFADLRRVMAENRSAISVGNEITRTRTLLKWLYDMRLIESAVHVGPDFRKPSKKIVRKQRREAGKKLFTAGQIHLILDECGVHFRAMVLLGINCAMGNTDVATLPLSAIDFGDDERADWRRQMGLTHAAWLNFARPKTEVDRLAPLWPETVAALRASLARRPEPGPEAKLLFFVRPNGIPWTGNHVAKRFRATYLAAGLSRGGFYFLRHGFATVAGAAKDPVAVSSILGHVDGSMAGQYREEIQPERLVAVCEHVRRWLFG